MQAEENKGSRMHFKQVPNDFPELMRPPTPAHVSAERWAVVWMVGPVLSIGNDGGVAGTTVGLRGDGGADGRWRGRRWVPVVDGRVDVV